MFIPSIFGRPAWIRKIAPIGLILGLFILGWFTARLRSPQLVLALCAVPLVVAIFSRVRGLEYGIVAILLTAGFVRFTIPTGTETELVASMVASGGMIMLWIAHMLVVDKRIHLEPSPLNVPLLGFMLTACVSYLWSNAFRDILVITWQTFPFVQLAGLIVMILLPGVFLLVANVIDDIKWLKISCWIIIALGVLSLLYLELPFPVARSFMVQLLNLENLGLLFLWAVAIPFSLALFNRGMSIWVRGLLLALAAVWMYFRMGLGMIWMSGWLPPLCAIYVIVFLRSKKLFLMLMLVTAIIIAVQFEWFYQRIWLDSVTEGDAERLDLWQTNLELVGNHPLFGTGPAGYAVYYMTYHPANARSTHNNYFDIVAQTGLVGFGLYIWFFVALSLLTYKLCLKLKGRGDFQESFAAAMMGGCAGLVVAMGLGDWVMPFIYNVGIRGYDQALWGWYLTGGVVVLHRIVDRHAVEQGTVSSDQRSLTRG